MLLPNISLSKEDFAISNWENIVNGCDKKKNEDYAMPFLKKAEEAKLPSELKKQAIFTLLAGITAPLLTADPSNEPFTQTDFINSINDGYLNALKDWASEITDAELRARIADLIWLKKHDFRMAKLAVDSYLESAQSLGDPSHWRACINRIKRARQLARQLNYDFGNGVACIESILTKYQDGDPSLLWARLMVLLQDNRKVDPSKYAVLAEKAATGAEVVSDWHKAREYWQIKRKWHIIAKDTQKVRKTELNICETYVKEAEDAIKRTSPSYFAASIHLKEAIEAFRNISGTQERVKEIHKKLLEYQELIEENEMIHFHYEFDIRETANLVRNKVKDKSFQEAIFYLPSLGVPPKVDELRSQVEKIAENNPVHSFFPMNIINEMGKTTAKQPSMLSSDEGEVKEATKAEMYRLAALYQRYITEAIIEPARYQILLEHNVRFTDWFLILVDSPFIPENREYIYAEGLQAGLTGNFLVAAHLLIPQIEHSIRYLLYKCGVITSKNTSKGIQDECDLNTTLYLPELENIIGKDLSFDLQGLLVNRFGCNLRNKMAHGLIDYGDFSSSHCRYLWWLTLRLCLSLPILSPIQTSQQEANETSENGEGDISTSIDES